MLANAVVNFVGFQRSRRWSSGWEGLCRTRCCTAPPTSRGRARRSSRTRRRCTASRRAACPCAGGTSSMPSSWNLGEFGDSATEFSVLYSSLSHGNSSDGVAVPRLCSGWTRWMAAFRCRMDLWEGHGITPMQRRWFGIPRSRATKFTDGSLVCCSSVHFSIVVSKCIVWRYRLVWKWEFLMHNLFLKGSLIHLFSEKS